MAEEVIKIPDIGGAGDVTEICVNVGDVIDAEDSLVVLESDKASMEVPAPKAGKVTAILVKEGDTLNEGDELIKLEAVGNSAATPQAEAHIASAVEASPATEQPEKEAFGPVSSEPVTVVKQVCVPDIGAENVPVIEIAVAVGDTIAKDDAIITLESDKASMEVPSPFDGKVVALKVKEGDELSNGDLVLEMEVQEASGAAPASVPATAPASAAEKKAEAPASKPSADSHALEKANHNIHAGPAVRMLAREFGVDLSLVKGSGPKGRILKEDVQAFVKERLSKPASASGQVGSGIPAMPAVDFSKWGEVEEKPLNRLRIVAARNFQRSWLNVPHVTQFDEADITGMEEFRKAQKEKALARGVRLTPLPFLLKACSYALEEMPQFCASLTPEGDKMIYKKYINIGVAVDTPDGLLVPVIKNVNKKSLYELAVECVEMAAKAKNKQLKPDEMQGGCFTISSLGSIGGTAFTPIVNAPEVAILGVSKASHKPLWNGKEFEPRLMLPLSLSYDHRAVNGADAAKFTSLLHELLSDIRRLLL